MKKIITLLFFAGAISTSFAQYSRQQNDDHRNSNNDQYTAYSKGDYDNRHQDSRFERSDRYDRDEQRFNHNGNSFSAIERNNQIARINRNFDYKIQSILYSGYLSRREKKLAIRNVEIERARQIRLVNERFISNTYDNYRGQYDKKR